MRAVRHDFGTGDARLERQRGRNLSRRIFLRAARAGWKIGRVHAHAFRSRRICASPASVWRGARATKERNKSEGSERRQTRVRTVRAFWGKIESSGYVTETVININEKVTVSIRLTLAAKGRPRAKPVRRVRRNRSRGTRIGGRRRYRCTAGGRQAGKSLKICWRAAFPARLAASTVSKRTDESFIGLFRPARYISHLHCFGGGARFLTTTEKSACSAPMLIAISMRSTAPQRQRRHRPRLKNQVTKPSIAIPCCAVAQRVLCAIESGD
jgi:hypothetical protein